ncbi:protein-L-isoaspartate O-methyltransferase family protein [Xylophilus sp.]|uniref:protein-L-isoaspartate O-methyltransferase family protein n=1 Tax=Xylophilus sp. TaxID=2653893 RepID=UPI0013BB9E1B|nr:protein-L-isoaspartate O-methyltransferase [Xylophilus sp.]KAF1048792.1 MAG: Protein-L-isoaspartate O-methyltransferase [Xylophilus sp.]
MNLPVNTLADVNDPLVQARFNMVEQQIRPWNVYDPDVLALLEAIPREQFVPPAHASLAFADVEIPLGHGQIMLAPKVAARIVNDLPLKATDSVLLIGAGSGYLAALLAGRTQRVIGLEIVPELARFAQDNLVRAGIHNAEVRQGDGAHGVLAESPFDVIVLAGSVPEVPQSLLRQLNDGGRLFAVVGSEPVQRATYVRRNGTSFETSQPWDTLAPRLVHFPEPSQFRF